MGLRTKNPAVRGRVLESTERNASLWIGPSGIACHALAEGGHSDVRDNGLSGLAGSAIVYAQIETRCLRFDTGQYQRPAAFRAGRPMVIDEFKFEWVCHRRLNQHSRGENSESIPRNRRRDRQPGALLAPAMFSAFAFEHAHGLASLGI